MGLFSSIFGDKKKSKSSSEQTKNETRSGTQSLEGIKSEDLTSTTKLLGDDVRTSVEDLILQISGGDAGNADEISNIASILLGRATGADADIQKSNDALLERARFEGTREVEALTSSLSRGAGAGKASNSFVAGATAEAEAALEIGLAGLGAELDLGARNTQTQEFTNAAQVFASGSAAGAADNNALAQLIQVLKGAEATTTQTGETVTNELATASEILDSIIKGTATESSKGQSSIFGQLFPKGFSG